MIATLVGISSGILVVLFIGVFKQLDKATMYGLILSGIGFLYVGFTWTDLTSLIITSIQAVAFLFIAYYGIKKNPLFLAIGYFLHGAWDMVYHLFDKPGLIPPQYEWFCLSIDFTMGFYLLLLRYRSANKKMNA
jgi:hypothetical protein